MIIFVIAAMIAAVARYVADYYLPRHGILLVNMIGSCIAGVVVSLALLFNLENAILQASIGGLAGSLTTFSTVAVSAAEQHIDATGSAVKTWALQGGLSIVAGLTGMFLTVTLVP